MHKLQLFYIYLCRNVWNGWLFVVSYTSEIYRKSTDIRCHQQFFACCDQYRFIVSITSSQCPHVRDTGKQRMSWRSDVVRSDLHLGQLQRVSLGFPVIPYDTSPMHVGLAEHIKTVQVRVSTNSTRTIPPSAIWSLGTFVWSILVLGAEFHPNMMFKRITYTKQ